ncbi:WD40 repeat-like protein [Paxillus ammoniavirescens]|nr:WD40 repeat-like protein [Paxillus ammoniavirescens]
MLTSSLAVSRNPSVSSKKASHRVPMQVFEGNEGWVRCVRFCLDEDKLVIGSGHSTLRVWNRTTGVVKVLHGHSGWVRDVEVSRDGKMVVSGSDDRMVRIWNRESGERIHVFEGHKDEVNSVQFSPDSSRVVSGSMDQTVRIWSVEMGELAFEPIECHGYVYCVRYSPSGDRIASGAASLQIWNAETGSEILSIRNSLVNSVAWTADGTHVIGGALHSVTIWNSYNGEQLRTWKYDDINFIQLSFSPTGTYLATCNWSEKTAFVFDVLTGEQIAELKHNADVQGIAYSPSGRLIATGCDEGKVYMWEAPVAEGPPAKSSAPPFSSLLDRPAIPPAGPSRNDGRGFDMFWDSLPNRDQQAPPSQLQRNFHKVRSTLSNVFTRRPTGAIHAIPNNPVRATVEPVEVAAGRDNIFWVVVLIPTYNAVEKFLYTLIHCRKPEDPDEEVPAATGTNSSQTAADNAATSNQSGCPETDDGAENTPTVGGGLGIRTQPQRTPAMRLSGESPGAEPYPSEIPVGDSQVYNQPESVGMVAIRETSTVSAHASPHRTPSTDPLSLITFHEPLSSTAIVTSAPLSVSSNSAPRTSGRTSSHNIEVPSVESLSPAEMAIIQELRRHKEAFSLVSTAPKSLGGSEYNSQSSVYPHPSASPPQLLGSPNQPRSHIHAQPSQASVGLDPLPLSSSARDDIKMTSTASPADQEDLQHAILRLQEEVDQLRQRVDDPKRKVVVERDELDTAVEGCPSLQAEPSGPKSTASTSQAGPSTFSNVPSQVHPPSSAQSIADSIEAEERAKEDKRRAKAERKKPRRKRRRNSA